MKPERVHEVKKAIKVEACRIIRAIYESGDEHTCNRAFYKSTVDYAVSEAMIILEDNGSYSKEELELAKGWLDHDEDWVLLGVLHEEY